MIHRVRSLIACRQQVLSHCVYKDLHTMASKSFNNTCENINTSEIRLENVILRRLPSIYLNQIEPFLYIVDEVSHCYISV